MQNSPSSFNKKSNTNSLAIKVQEQKINKYLKSLNDEELLEANIKRIKLNLHISTPPNFRNIMLVKKHLTSMKQHYNLTKLNCINNTISTVRNLPTTYQSMEIAECNDIETVVFQSNYIFIFMDISNLQSTYEQIQLGKLAKENNKVLRVITYGIDGNKNKE